MSKQVSTEQVPPKKPNKSFSKTLYHIFEVLLGPCVKHHSVTHVANATENDIWVLCDGDRKYINRTNANFQTAVGQASFERAEEVYYAANSVGFTKIKSGDVLAFELHHNGIIYVSIRETKENGWCRTVCDCFPIRHDQSVICGPGGYVYKTEYNSLWVEDLWGHNFNPKLPENKQPTSEKSEEPSEKIELRRVESDTVVNV